MSVNPGDPVFPRPQFAYPNGKINHGNVGMDIRTYIATHIMAAAVVGLDNANEDYCANMAVACADALIYRLNEEED